MKTSKFNDSQIMDAVNRVEARIGVSDICRELGIQGNWHGGPRKLMAK